MVDDDDVDVGCWEEQKKRLMMGGCADLFWLT
jgi:hypothetical protein